jgi:molybdopterin converting factor small subunit
MQGFSDFTKLTFKPNHRAILVYVSVTFLGLQRAKAQTDQIQVPLPKETRVADLLAYIKECYPNLPFPDEGILVAVNNKLSSMERVLKNKDNVTFLPAIGGG